MNLIVTLRLIRLMGMQPHAIVEAADPPGLGFTLLVCFPFITSMSPQNENLKVFLALLNTKVISLLGNGAAKLRSSVLGSCV